MCQEQKLCTKQRRGVFGFGKKEFEDVMKQLTQKYPSYPQYHLLAALCSYALYTCLWCVNGTSNCQRWLGSRKSIWIRITQIDPIHVQGIHNHIQRQLLGYSRSASKIFRYITIWWYIQTLNVNLEWSETVAIFSTQLAEAYVIVALALEID